MSAPIEIVRSIRSDWNRRFVMRLHDGAEVEAVLYREHTLCVSCQVGCAVQCPFCASGANGLSRPLLCEEMIAQVEHVESLGVKIENVTVSGVGEPLHNARRVEEFVSYCHRRNTPASVTTSGGPVETLRIWLKNEGNIFPHHGLTISVHAGTEAARAKLVPKGPSLDALYRTIEEALPQMSRRRRKKTALAYLLIAGENDGDAELDAFIARTAPLGLSIHLYAHNTVPTSDMRGVTRADYERVYARFREAGLVVRMSSQARIEPNGGCGTLVALRRRDRLPLQDDLRIR